jgi:hypothetical protein
VSIAGRFQEAIDDVDDPVLAAPELLPARLSRAAAGMLAVEGAGLSVAGPDGERIPLGASSEEAACAERLQFTVGAGPCITAQGSREPVFGSLAELRRRWPAFADLLVARTPFRAVVALPLREAFSGLGAIDLYLTGDDEVPRLDVFEAMAVGDLVTSALSEAAVWSEWAAERGPDWLHGPPAVRRTAVWEAMGKVALALDVGSPTALALMRGAAYAAGSTVDEIADDLLSARRDPGSLRDTDGRG